MWSHSWDVRWVGCFITTNHLKEHHPVPSPGYLRLPQESAPPSLPWDPGEATSSSQVHWLREKGISGVTQRECQGSHDWVLKTPFKSGVNLFLSYFISQRKRNHHTSPPKGGKWNPTICLEETAKTFVNRNYDNQTKLYNNQKLTLVKTGGI